MEKNCEYCGEKFKSKNQNQRFCCKSCAMKARYNEDVGLFDRQDIDDKIKKYILGLIVTDGCIRKNGICISLKDHYMIYQIHDLVAPNRKCYNNLDNLQVIWRNQKDLDYLYSIGITERKTRTVPFHSGLSNIWDYVRGIFDGDGCAYISKAYDKNYMREYKYLYISITSGSKSFVNGFNNFLKDYDFSPRIIQDTRHKETWQIKIFPQKDVKRFFNYIYKDASIWKLQRKYDLTNFFTK